MSAAVQVRVALEADSVALSELITQLGYPTDPERMSRRLSEMLPNPRLATLVAVCDDRVGGMIGLELRQSYEFDGFQCWILALVVDQRFRGRGVGKMLLTHSEAWAASQGAWKITVNTAHHRSGAHRFYEVSGYQSTGLRFTKLLR